MGLVRELLIKSENPDTLPSFEKKWKKIRVLTVFDNSLPRPENEP